MLFQRLPPALPAFIEHLQPLELRPREGTPTVIGPDLDTQPWETAIDWAKDLSRRYEFWSLETADWVGRDTEALLLLSWWSCKGGCHVGLHASKTSPITQDRRAEGCRHEAVWSESSRTRERCLLSCHFPYFLHCTLECICQFPNNPLLKSTSLSGFLLFVTDNLPPHLSGFKICYTVKTSMVGRVSYKKVTQLVCYWKTKGQKETRSNEQILSGPL